jgi:hypothetical protein
MENFDTPQEVEIMVNQFSFDMGDCLSNIRNMRSAGLMKGAWLGFSNLDEFYTMKRGSMTYLVAAPHCGKSALINEFVINLIEFSKFKVIIYSPETGTPSDIMVELLWSKCKRPYIKNKAGINATDEEAEEAIRFLSENVVILDFGLQLPTIDMIYAQVARLKEEGFDADLLVIDPAVEIQSSKSKGVREDIAVEELTNKVRRFSSHYDIHTLIAIHTKAMEKRKGQTVAGEEIFYYPQPTMNDIAGGQTWARKGMMILTLWRPPKGFPKDDVGGFYEENELVIEVVKARPKSAGKLGRCVLKYDRISNRFKEEIDRQYHFSYPCKDGFTEREISPNNIQEITRRNTPTVQSNIW